MHIVEPDELKQRKEKRLKRAERRARIGSVVIFLIIICLAASTWAMKDKFYKPKKNNSNNEPVAQLEQSAPQSTKRGTKLKIFTGNQFKDLYRSVNYPNTESFSVPPEITGSEEADKIIRELAKKRGFVLTSQPVSPILKTNEPLLAGSEDDLLQPLALTAWQKLKEEANKAGIKVTLISAYRSVSWQRDLFKERLYAEGVTNEQISAGQASAAVEKTLSLTAVPGYSRHHTGYTIDLYCQDGNGAFADSSCYRWLNSNNYENAKKFGWIPSYPEDAKEQGPEPEAWEYVWVGTDALYE